MPPKRSKKNPAAPKVQGKLNFQRVQKPHTTVSPLVHVLSQYELMIMVTDRLSSADIIHLTATCKEIKTYLTDDKTIYASITERANCDGKGIEARAKCFGHWKGDVTNANVRCGGSDCQPCDDCHAMVCNECRYHISYMTKSPCCRDDPLHWESHEVDCAMDLDIVRRCHGHCDECPEFHSGTFPIESIRAASLAGEPRERRYCSECRPGFAKNKKLNYESIHELLAITDYMDDWCCCTLADQFIEDSWLCLPCFFKQEAQAHSRCLKRGAYRWEDGEDGKTRKLVKTEEYLCDCGRVADIPYLVECRWCEEPIHTPEVEVLLEELDDM
ncbi:hypothetical protein E4T50_14923 [Aureobasidium sp. EXF-12298]|nr:hypothetical protein E4T50_14923 [Aureobasidium sp. EXF-12298]KAI4755672.1 hypothetical protein E4T51_11236 [Aureobasidium sp. EXF-12344]KAI4772752.1 hypothetical protein E4T52_12288 [Aureobasidium sp. EXF-3400]